ncbi:F-box domain-containing protein [Mycena venus]|uniref:F-box domain-containing protein n=1 Tax=Mycena venus TaxID=2733690 RepID=A0A8H7CED6_9AGAR|nr:F-box domain-containing protein [Mycena venus]
MLSALEADRIRVAEIDAQIRDLEHSLATLRIQKTLSQERLDAYKYPVLTLPTEIVSEIFIHFLPPYPHCPPLTGILSPTVLTQICRQWRELALANPMLWRAIPVNLDEGIPLQQRTHICDVWLSRSRCPLSIQIVGFGEEEYFSDVLTSVFSHRVRWEYLELSEGMPFNLSAIEGPMPLVRDLHLSLLDSVLEDKVAFYEMPMLRTVFLNSCAVASVILPWIQLTSLTLYNVYPSECSPILQQTPNLVQCKLHVWLERRNPHPEPDIELPNLESLVLRDFGSSPLGYLQTFLIPALRSLSVPERLVWPNPIESLASFITKSGCRLQQVRITGESSVPEASYRDAMRSVGEISFSNLHPDDE